jgi:PDZ domain
MTMRHLNLLVAIGCVVGAPIATFPVAASEVAAAPARPAPTQQQVAGWIGELDHNRYVVREAATRHLLAAGTLAFDALLAAANGDRPEPSDRAIWILRRSNAAQDPLVRRKALEYLARVEGRPQVAAAAREALAQIEHNEAVRAIQELGGRFVSAQFINAVGPFSEGRIILDQQWRGGDAGLTHLRHVLGLRQVIIIGTDISVQGLAQLKDCELLQDLWLYGTKLEPEDLPEVKKLLPAQVAIDYRRGALLGVGSNSPDGLGPAVVGTVQPGSAAETAGIQVGDVIQRFEGEQIANFKTLTAKIGDHRPGDDVTIEVLRGDETTEFKLKLGQWQTIE